MNSIRTDVPLQQSQAINQQPGQPIDQSQLQENAAVFANLVARSSPKDGAPTQSANNPSANGNPAANDTAANLGAHQKSTQTSSTGSVILDNLVNDSTKAGQTVMNNITNKGVGMPVGQPITPWAQPSTTTQNPIPAQAPVSPVPAQAPASPAPAQAPALPAPAQAPVPPVPAQTPASPAPAQGPASPTPAQTPALPPSAHPSGPAISLNQGAPGGPVSAQSSQAAQISSSIAAPDAKSAKSISEATINAQNMQPGDAILGALLHSLNASSGAQSTQQGVQPSASADIPARVNQIAQQVAQQIMVAQPDLQGKQEVVIVLKDNILPGTQIHVTRNDNNLSITFQSSVATSANLLSQSQPTIQQALQTHLGEAVTIQVRDNSSGSSSQNSYNMMDNQGNNSQRRSSQYIEYTPDEQQ